jgi:hypothetical protein
MRSSPVPSSVRQKSEHKLYQKFRSKYPTGKGMARIETRDTGLIASSLSYQSTMLLAKGDMAVKDVVSAETFFGCFDGDACAIKCQPCLNGGCQERLHNN